MAGILEFESEFLEEFFVLKLIDVGAPNISQLEQGPVELLLINVVERLGGLIIGIILISVSFHLLFCNEKFSITAVSLKLFLNDLLKLVSINTWSQKTPDL